MGKGAKEGLGGQEGRETSVRMYYMRINEKEKEKAKTVSNSLVCSVMYLVIHRNTTALKMCELL